MQRMDNTDVTTPLTSTSQFIEADDDDLDEDAIPGFTHPGLVPSPHTPAQDKGKARAPEQLAPPSGSPSLSGNIGTPVNGSGAPSNRRSVGGVQVETRYSGVDTLDEPITTTIARDLFSIYVKLIQVLYPPRGRGDRDLLKDWDLWGPLVLCLTLGILLSISAPPAQSLGVFTSVVVIIAVGSLVVTIQAKLLGGRVSFFQGLCVLGYCVAPLNIAALVSTFVHLIYVRAPVALAAWAWCVWASVNFLDGTKIEHQRILLAVYPLLLFYFVLAWMIIIQ
ncbi:Yip1-domain-containing protein [Polyporus arcularius HHB13444]|uniref:Protein YIP n=1 Tax=Polyporus arcularius HHB13444 TaxID=1314778 RepID=A0A5C3PVG3_9APHY|nr:Yip1-domain-containing protein [Polyporus arcularius HHB13444]